MNNRKLGSRYEALAARFLEGKGVRVIEQNYRNRFGEIDLIARDQGVLCFIEVKYRTTEQAGFAEEAVDVRKQTKISKVSDYYRMVHQIDSEQPIRFDVIAVTGDQLNWYQDAFPYRGQFFC